jgi:hypothetical protein
VPTLYARGLQAADGSTHFEPAGRPDEGQLQRILDIAAAAASIGVLSDG